MATPTTYITTPIYYVNDKPHIGHVYTTTVADVMARHYRLRGRDVFFLTGTDEHAAKVADAAEERGLTPQQWADQNAGVYEEIFGELQLTYDDFIRTSQSRHVDRVVRYVSALLESGDVYLGEYEGWYDAGQEEYIPENKARELEYKSPYNGKPLVRKTEQNYFFRLSAYADELLALLDKGEPFEVKPPSRKNEVMGRIREGLNDVPMSRTGAGDWGIKVPGDDAHSIYVWIDALFNYLSTIDSDERRKYWPADVHLIGKEILWFHAVIWPAMLLALQKRSGFEWVKLPRQVYAHSFWISEGRKMSKSMGNFIDLATIRQYVATYSLDALRYYLITQGPLGTTDADFAAAHFHDTYSTDLVNTFGNSASRITAMVNKYFDGVLPPASAEHATVVAEFDWPEITRQATADVVNAFDRTDPAAAAAAALGLVRRIDAFINVTEPFKMAKDESRRGELVAILFQCLEALRIAAVLLHPVLPGKTAELFAAVGIDGAPLGGDFDALTEWDGPHALPPGTSISKVALFPRVEEAIQPLPLA